MYQLVYISHSKDPNITQANIMYLLESSRQNNKRDEITGMLIFRAGLFMQLLEGPKEKVLGCFNRICEDNRHHNIQILLMNDVNERIFDNWNMAYQDLSSFDQIKLQEFIPKITTENLRGGLNRVGNKKILDTLKTFREDLV